MHCPQADHLFLSQLSHICGGGVNGRVELGGQAHSLNHHLSALPDDWTQLLDASTFGPWPCNSGTTGKILLSIST